MSHSAETPRQTKPRSQSRAGLPSWTSWAESGRGGSGPWLLGTRGGHHSLTIAKSQGPVWQGPVWQPQNWGWAEAGDQKRGARGREAGQDGLVSKGTFTTQGHADASVRCSWLWTGGGRPRGLGGDQRSPQPALSSPCLHNGPVTSA